MNDTLFVDNRRRKRETRFPKHTYCDSRITKVPVSSLRKMAFRKESSTTFWYRHHTNEVDVEENNWKQNEDNYVPGLSRMKKTLRRRGY